MGGNFKNTKKKIYSLFIFLIASIFIGTAALAATDAKEDASKDVSVSISTDKDNYKSDEKANVKIKVNNDSSENIKNIRIAIPSEFKQEFSDSALLKDSIKSGDNYEVSGYVYSNKDCEIITSNSFDKSNLAIIGGAFISIIVLCVASKKGKKSLFIVSGILVFFALQNLGVQEAFASSNICSSAIKKIVFGDYKTDLAVTVYYDFENETSNDKSSDTPKCEDPDVGDNDSSTNTPKKEIDETSTNTPIKNESTSTPKKDEFEENINYSLESYELQYNGRDDENQDKVNEKLIKSKEELKDFLNQYKDNESDDFNIYDILGKYSDSYFSKHVLYIKRYISGTGRSALDVKYVKSHQDNVKIYMNNYIHINGTSCDCMSEQLFCVDLPRDKVENKKVEYIDTNVFKNYADDGLKVKYTDIKADNCTGTNEGIYISSCDKLNAYLKYYNINDSSIKYDDKYFEDNVLVAVNLSMPAHYTASIDSYVSYFDGLTINASKIADSSGDSSINRICFIEICKSYRPVNNVISINVNEKYSSKQGDLSYKANVLGVPLTKDNSEFKEVVKTREELMKYISLYSKEDNESYDENKYNDLVNEAEKYDDSFFEKHSLFIANNNIDCYSVKSVIGDKNNVYVNLNTSSVSFDPSIDYTKDSLVLVELLTDEIANRSVDIKNDLNVYTLNDNCTYLQANINTNAKITSIKRNSPFCISTYDDLINFSKDNSFKDISKYNKEFFTDNKLILVYLDEDSGYFDYSLDSITSNNSGTILTANKVSLTDKDKIENEKIMVISVASWCIRNDKDLSLEFKED